MIMMIGYLITKAQLVQLVFIIHNKDCSSDFKELSKDQSCYLVPHNNKLNNFFI